MDLLIDDVIVLILKHVDIHSLYYLFITNKKFNNFSTNKEIWNHHYDKLAVPFEISDNEFRDKCKTFMTLCSLGKRLKYKYTSHQLEILYRSEYLSRCYKYIMIPKSIVILQQLKEVYLDGNKITQFPKALLSLKNLEELSLGINRISIIPKDIYKLKTLKTLKLYSNKISRIPCELSKMKNLKNLYLFRNKISKIPHELSQLKNIEFIELQHNLLTEIPEKILQIKTLKKIFLEGNPMVKIPNHSLNLNLEIIL